MTFKENEYVVYPNYGVGQINSIENNKICGSEINLLIINFLNPKSTIKVPVEKSEKQGLRHLTNEDELNNSLNILSKKTKQNKISWFKRSNDYKNKINSGKIDLILEVLRDLHTPEDKKDKQSNSETLLYNFALSRFIDEASIVYNKNKNDCISILDSYFKMV